MTDAERGQVATTAAEVYEEFFLPALFDQWPERVLDAAGVTSGEAVLDLGSGTGILARTALDRVGPDGRVVGLDPNEGMLAVARRTASGVEWQRGAAEAMPFDEEVFDVVVSQFAMMFFEDPAASVGEIRRVLRPGGRAAIVTWASLDVTPGYAAMVGVLDELFGADAADALRAPYSMGDTEDLADLVGTHLDDVEVSVLEGVARFGSIDAWVHTDVRGWTLSDMSDEDYERLLDAARPALRQFTDDSGAVEFPAPALVAVGSKN